MSILLTGGLGFIGSHCAVELINQNYDIVIIDNLSNSNKNVLDNIEKITNKKINYYQYDLSNYKNVKKVFERHQIINIINLVGFKAVGESVKNPLKYYDNNIGSLLVLLKCMLEYNVKNLIFSSSATVYGHPESLPLYEDSNLNVLNPYGQTKLMSEIILQDCVKAYNMNITILRYFNPVGAHPSGLIGDTSINNLFPMIMYCYKNNQSLKIFGSDYNTPDKTCIRDYIHVIDLAKGHVKAMNNMNKLKIYNLGTGKGYSVLEIVNTFNKYKKLEYEFKNRREGDTDEIYANATKANQELEWIPMYDLDDMVRDTLNFK